MKFGSLFSGIGGFDLGFEQAGLECAWQCEIDKAARSVLAKHWPGVPCYEDIRDVGRRNAPAVDLICGGFPCQDLSVAGKRAGLAGERSGLYWQMRRIVRELKPQWVVIENVPGLLSSNGGNDFAVVVRGLAKCGYRIAWRVLDAQYFGVAQRRRRVFIVGSLGDGRAAEILFERDGLFGHPPARRAQGQGVAGTIGAQSPSRRNGGSDPVADHFVNVMIAKPLGNHHQRQDLDNDTYIVNEPQTFDWQAGVASGKDRVEITDPPGRTRSLSASRSLAIYNIQHNDGGQHKRKDRPEGGLYVTETDLALTVGTTDLTAIAYGGNNTSGAIEIAAAVNAKGGSGRMDFESETFVFEPRYARNGRGAPDTIAPPLKAQNGGTGKGDGAPVVAFAGMAQSGAGWAPPSCPTSEDLALPLDTTRAQSVIASGVRRLTPTECTRLQGFPDDWQEVSDADETQAHAREVLHGMWREIGAQNREGRRLRIALALLTPEILLAGVHGGWISWEMAAQSATASRKIQGANAWPEGFMYALRQAREDRPSPYRRQSFEQLARELGRLVQELPLEGAQARAHLLNSSVWTEASQEWPLRHAQSTGTPWRGTDLSDSARYRQLGNAVCVNVARWIGEKIVEVLGDAPLRH